MASADEDERLGLLLRAIRRRGEMTQARLAAQADVPRGDVITVEAGRASELELGRLRRMFAAADGRLNVAAWWHGAAADRLLDERHARIVERAARVYLRWSWLTAVEVTFSEYGERGSLDLLAVHPPSRSAAVNEIKASLGSLEETNRSLDVKVRLAPKVVEAQFGWRPSTVSRVLVLPDDDTLRRIVARHAATMDSAYPSRSRDVRGWIWPPSSASAGPHGSLRSRTWRHGFAFRPGDRAREPPDLAQKSRIRHNCAKSGYWTGQRAATMSLSATFAGTAAGPAHWGRRARPLATLRAGPAPPPPPRPGSTDRALD